MAFVDRLMVPGDRVIMKMDKESRSYRGDEYPPDGTLGTFLGCKRVTIYRSRVGNDAHFYEPGIYECDGVAIIKWDNGSDKVDGWSHEMLDKTEYKRRFEAWHAIKDKPHDFGEHVVRVGDLPETRFWEGDIVALRDPRGHVLNRLSVDSIEFNWGRNKDGFAYRVNWVDENNVYAKFGSTHCRSSELKLIERGNVWKEEHGGTLVFANLQQEAGYAKWRGRTEDIRNPANGLYRWSKDEVLAAIQDGIVDAFNLSSDMFSVFQNDRVNAIRFKNRDLGERVRQETMLGFGMSAKKL